MYLILISGEDSRVHIKPVSEEKTLCGIPLVNYTTLPSSSPLPDTTCQGCLNHPSANAGFSLGARR